MNRLIVVSAFVIVMLISINSASASRVADSDRLFSRIHFSVGYGPSLGSAGGDMFNAFYASGFDGTRSVLYSQTHFPVEKSNNWSLNYEASFRWAQNWQASFGVYTVPGEQVLGAGGISFLDRGEREEVSGNSYYLTVDYLLKPINTWSKWEFSAGVGLSYSALSISGDLGSYWANPGAMESEPWELSENKMGGVFRANLDYYFIKSTSIQVRMSEFVIPSVDVPRQEFSTKMLIAHSVNFSAFEITLRFVTHL